MLADALVEKFGNFDLLFEQADTSLTVGKLAAFSAVLGLAGGAVAVVMKSPVRRWSRWPASPPVRCPWCWLLFRRKQAAEDSSARSFPTPWK